jgi:hypothetical protein
MKTGDIIKIRSDFLHGLRARVIAVHHRYLTIELLEDSPDAKVWKAGNKLTVAPYEAALIRDRHEQ